MELIEQDINCKIKLIKSLNDLENMGIKFNKYYTISDDIEELIFANEYGKKMLTQMTMENELKQLGQLIGLGLKIINIQKSKESPFNPDNCDPNVCKILESNVINPYCSNIQVKNDIVINNIVKNDSVDNKDNKDN
jgi:hypothetical protein